MTPVRAIAAASSTAAPAAWSGGGVYGHWGVNATVVAVTVVAVAVCVILHYEVLSALSRGLGRLERAEGGHRRRRVLYGIFGVLSVHVVEIWVFGVVFFLLQWLGPVFGEVQGIAPRSLVDHVYFSAVTFTTVGFGDVIPSGPVRFLAGTEALCGFVLITWSASFTYLEMHRFWRRD